MDRLRTFASQAIGRRRKSRPAALAGKGAGVVDANSVGADVAGRTLVNIWQEDTHTHLQMLTVKHFATSDGLNRQVLDRPSQSLPSAVTW